MPSPLLHLAIEHIDSPIGATGPVLTRHEAVHAERDVVQGDACDGGARSIFSDELQPEPAKGTDSASADWHLGREGVPRETAARQNLSWLPPKLPERLASGG